jgi:histidinol-phosphate phosphatase family protein
MLAPWPAVARPGAAVWLATTLAFAWRRIAPGPRTPREIATMLATSALIPPLALWHRARGTWRAWRDLPRRPPRAVLLDRDGTLIADVPGNADPARVRVMPGARRALDRLRAAGVRLAVVTNQGAVGEGRLTPAELAAINARVDALLGPFDAWVVCAHAADAGCACRKPQPGAVRQALALLGAAPGDSVLIGDIGSDVAAARAAGVRAILVPTPVTKAAEVRAAPEVVRDLAAAVRRLLEGA